MRRPRILVLTKTTQLGGAERLLINTLAHLDRERFDYRFAALDDHGPLAAACRAAQLPFQALPGRRAFDPRNALALRQILVRQGIALVHAHLPLVGALTRLAARGLGIPVVYTEHNLQQQYRAPSRWLNAATFGWQTRAVAVSQGVRRSVGRSMGVAALERTAVVPNGVDFDQLDDEAAYQPGPGLPRRRRGEFLLLVPASLEPRKGHDLLLNALESLQDRPFPPLGAWLAGDGPLREELASRIARSGLAGSVHLLGRRGDVFALMDRADAVVLPSRFEGHPLALLEALALGRPVVAAAVGGVPEIVAPEQTGVLVPPEDPEALAAAIQRLRAEPALRERLGLNAALDARRRFDVRDSVAALERIYRECLTPAGVAAPRPGPRHRRPTPGPAPRPAAAPGPEPPAR